MRRGRVSAGMAGLTQGLVRVCENSSLRVLTGNIVSCINVYTLSYIMHRFVLVRFAPGRVVVVCRPLAPLGGNN